MMIIYIHICRVGSRGDVILSGDYILEDHCIFENQDGKLCIMHAIMCAGCEYVAY